MFWEISRELGTILKSHGTKGDLVIGTSFEIPQNFKMPESVFLVIDGLPVPFFIEHYSIISDETIIVKFESINEKEQVSQYYNCSVRMESKYFKKIKVIPNINSLIGYTVLDDELNELGKVSDFMDIPMNPLLQIDYKDKEILLPINNDTLLDFNEKEKRIVLFVPDGLIEE